MNNIYIRQLSNNLLSDNFLIFVQSVTLVMIVLWGITNASAQEKASGFKITSPVSGVVKQVYAQVGKTIKQGDLLLEFDDSLIVSNLAEAKASMKLAKLNRAEAKKELERAEELYDRTVLSEHELQQAKVLYSKASAQYASADNQLIHAQWDKTHSKLYAPFHGRIIQVFSYPGQYVNNELTAQTLMIMATDK